MRILVILSFAIAVLGCENEAVEKSDPGRVKKVVVSFQGIEISTKPLTGREQRTTDADPTYLFIEIRKGSALYASGVFKDVPQSVGLQLPDKTNVTIFVKAIKKGSSHGILRYKSGIYTNINWSVAADSLNYQNPMQNGADAGLCYVYTKPDSSANMYQYYPPTDTYAAKVEINTSTITGELKINLERKVFGIESKLRNFRKGKVKVLLGEEKSATDPSGVSSQVLSYPDSSKLDVFSLMALHPPRPNIRLRVIYHNTEKDQVIFDGWIEVNALEKKILEIDLARFNSTNNGRLGFTIVNGSLVPGQIIKIN